MSNINIISYLAVFLNIIGGIIFLYIFWKKQKEDFGSDTIFTSAFYILIGIISSLIISHSFLPLWWFWFALAGVCFGFGLAYYRYRLKIYETVESLVISFLPWLLMIYVYYGATTLNAGSIVMGVVTLILVVAYFILDTHYKKFAWYKSGRVGFSGLTVGAAYFLSRAVVVLVFDNVISLSGNLDAIISAIVAFLMFISIYNLSQKTAF